MATQPMKRCKFEETHKQIMIHELVTNKNWNPTSDQIRQWMWPELFNKSLKQIQAWMQQYRVYHTQSGNVRPSRVGKTLRKKRGRPKRTSLGKDDPNPHQKEEPGVVPTFAHATKKHKTAPCLSPVGSRVQAPLSSGTRVLSSSPNGTPVLSSLPNGTPVLSSLPNGTPVLSSLPSGTPVLSSLPNGTPVLSSLPNRTFVPLSDSFSASQGHSTDIHPVRHGDSSAPPQKIPDLPLAPAGVHDADPDEPPDPFPQVLRDANTTSLAFLSAWNSKCLEAVNRQLEHVQHQIYTLTHRMQTRSPIVPPTVPARALPNPCTKESKPLVVHTSSGVSIGSPTQSPLASPRSFFHLDIPFWEDWVPTHSLPTSIAVE
jgi:hypothetical protein